MRRMSFAGALASLIAAVFLAAPVVGRQEPVDTPPPPPPPPIKELMGKLNKGPEALTSSIGRNLDKPEPDWATLASQCKDYLDNVKHLGKNVPPRGEPASWERLTKAYQENARVLAIAVKNQDRKAALAAHGKIEQSCSRCHVNHKP